jgi:hypothetical protein
VGSNAALDSVMQRAMAGHEYPAFDTPPLQNGDVPL